MVLPKNVKDVFKRYNGHAQILRYNDHVKEGHWFRDDKNYRWNSSFYDYLNMIVAYFKDTIVHFLWVVSPEIAVNFGK